MRWAGYLALREKWRRGAYMVYLWVNLSEEDHLEDQNVDKK
jgi:hypothetical protein